MIESTTSDPLLQLLGQCFQTATEHASIAMSRWTSGQVRLAVDAVHEMPLEAVASSFSLEEEPLTIVVVGISDDPESQLFLTFDEQNGRRLVASLLGRQRATTAEWSELEKSAAMETGNIFSSAYLSELSRLVDERLVPSPPCFIQDFGGSVLEQALFAHALTSDQILVCHTSFEFSQEAMNWNMLFVPSPRLRQALEQSITTAL